MTWEECWFSWGLFTAAILVDASWDIFFTLAEDAVEALFLVFKTVLEAILTFSAELWYQLLNQGT